MYCNYPIGTSVSFEAGNTSAAFAFVVSNLPPVRTISYTQWRFSECSYYNGRDEHVNFSRSDLAKLVLLKKNFWIPLCTFWRGNGNPLQYSCLENPMDGVAW